jgi:hypothetical protein
MSSIIDEDFSYTHPRRGQRWVRAKETFEKHEYSYEEKLLRTMCELWKKTRLYCFLLWGTTRRTCF